MLKVKCDSQYGLKAVIIQVDDRFTDEDWQAAYHQARSYLGEPAPAFGKTYDIRLHGTYWYLRVDGREQPYLLPCTGYFQDEEIARLVLEKEAAKDREKVAA